MSALPERRARAVFRDGNRLTKARYVRAELACGRHRVIMKAFRPDKVASAVRTIVSDMIADKLQDPRISRFASVTRVEVSGDLQVAKVHISVLGSEADQRSTMRGLEHARGHVQRAVAQGIRARRCPEVRFIADGSLKKAAEIVRIIDENAPPPEEDDPARESIADQPHRADGAAT